ncbi:MAG: hypothetical protein WC682_05080 [Parcubacteria group bacterium]|jgi:hypothetical protein
MSTMLFDMTGITLFGPLRSSFSEASQNDIIGDIKNWIFIDLDIV